MITFNELRYRLAEVVQRLEHQAILQEFLELDEDSTFYIYRTDTNAVLARGIHGFEAAKARATQIRKTQNLKWDQVKFKSERQTPRKFGVSPSGRTFTNARGDTGRIDVANRMNPSKGRPFRGYTDSQGNYHDID